MPIEPEDMSDARAAPALEQALLLLSSGTEVLRSLSLHEEAREVAAVIERLRGDSARTGHNVFRREGEYRLVLYESDVFRLKETVGVTYLAKLLSSPGREIHVLELAGSDVSLASDAGPALDADARRAYRERLDELAADVADAEAANDLERAAQARQEIEVLRRELSRGVGLGGRARASSSTSERARQAVTKALKSALARIHAESPSLSGHLATAIRTGTYCRYDPDPRLPIVWRV